MGKKSFRKCCQQLRTLFLGEGLSVGGKLIMSGEVKTLFARIVSGNLTKGLQGRLLKDFSAEEIKVGSVVLIKGVRKETKFLGVVSDIELKGSNVLESFIGKETNKDRVASEIRERTEKGLRSSGSLPTVLHIAPLAVYRGEVEQVDSIPDYCAPVIYPFQEEINLFYGKPNYLTSWPLGKPKLPLIEKEEKVYIPLNVETLVRGSFGIFGKSGAGKTFLGNLLAFFIILTNKSLSEGGKLKLLIFDMHSEYGLMLKDQVGRDYAKGVGQVFRDQFFILTPDKETAETRNLETLKVNPGKICVEDIEIISETLGLTPAFLAYLTSFKRIIQEVTGKNWLEVLCGKTETSPSEEEEIATKIQGKLGIGAYQSFKAGKTRLGKLKKLDFIDWTEGKDAIEEIINEILKGRRSVIVSFGRYGDNKIAYMLIANMVARRLWEKYVELSLKGKKTFYRLVIFLEEAHKFLGPKTFYMTPFGDIARELRKRGVVLCIIDQRPSQIDEDVRGMLWNSFIMNLTDEADIQACTRGLRFQRMFQPIIEWLKRKEVLVFGESITIPAVLEILNYKEGIKSCLQEFSERRREEEIEPPDY